MRIEKEHYKKTRYWPAGTDFIAHGHVVEDGKRWRVFGMGKTARAAVLDLLFQQGRRRTTPLV
jgi:hypothetical protein